jgi:RND family efflux transporter MFP subunit
MGDCVGRVKFVVVAVAAGTCVIVAAGVGWKMGNMSRPIAANPAAQTDVGPNRQPALPGDGEPAFLGVLVSESSTEVTAGVEGRVALFETRLGELVDPKTLVVRLHSPSLLQELQRAKADLGAAEADLERAVVRHEEARQGLDRALQVERFLSDAELQTERAKVRLAESESEIARQHVVRVTTRLNELLDLHKETEVRPPFSGRLGARLVEVGAWARPGTPLFKVVGDDRFRVRFAVPQDRVLQTQAGATICLQFENGAVATGTVNQIAPEADSASGMVLAEGWLSAAQGPPGDQPRAGSVVRVRPNACPASPGTLR